MAEFGLLDAQLANLKRLLSDSEGSVDGETGNKEAVTSEVMDEADRVTILDEDELEVRSRSMSSAYLPRDVDKPRGGSM